MCYWIIEERVNLKVKRFVSEGVLFKIYIFSAVEFNRDFKLSHA